jgi:YidC/Oxa1 family membrane protein insertase
MGDSRRLLLAFLLILGLLFLWTVFTGKRKPEAKSAAPVPTQSTGTPAPAQSPAAAVPTVAPPRQSLQPELTETLDNAQLRVVISSKGGAIRSAWLKRYRVELVPAGTHFGGLSLIRDQGLLDLTGLDFELCRDGAELTGTASLGEQQVVRRYELSRDFLLLTSVALSEPNAGYVLQFHDGTALTEKNVGEDANNVNLLCQNKGIERYGTRQVGVRKVLNQPVHWVGTKSMYFLTALMPEQGALDTVTAWTLGDRRIGWQAGVKGNRTADSYRLYLGPLDYTVLSRNRLGSAFDFGKFLFLDLKWIGLPILKLLQWLHALLGNFGLAIVIFALVVKGVFYPLSRIQNRQMRQMALLQPKLEELKKRYKNDAEGLNRETMQLYKLYKVNPLYGCLPLLIQMPIFFALYQVLRMSVDMRQAQFVFWIKDLSLKDPYYVLPILMGGFSILQSLLTSTGQQNKLLTFVMPVMITVIFINFPSGLQLYWLVFNILSIFESIIAQGGVKWLKKVKLSQPANP